jgi:hypothetical protein
VLHTARVAPLTRTASDSSRPVTAFICAPANSRHMVPVMAATGPAAAPPATTSSAVRTVPSARGRVYRSRRQPVRQCCREHPTRNDDAAPDESAKE